MFGLLVVVTAVLVAGWGTQQQATSYYSVHIEATSPLPLASTFD